MMNIVNGWQEMKIIVNGWQGTRIIVNKWQRVLNLVPSWRKRSLFGRCCQEKIILCKHASNMSDHQTQEVGELEEARTNQFTYGEICLL